jgi:hypothetical protein
MYNDERELGLNVYHLYVVEADQVGTPPEVTDAVPLAPSLPAAAAKVPAR